MPTRERKDTKMEDSSDDESYSNDPDWSSGGRVRSDRGTVTKTSKARRSKKASFRTKRPPKYMTERFLEDAGKLRKTDVLLGRGPNFCAHHGNVVFRLFCFLVRPVYVHDGTGRSLKSNIASLIVKLMASLRPTGRFVECGSEDSTYFILPEAKTLEKTCQALRENKMSCPMAFRGLLTALEEAESKEEKAELIAFATGVDLKTFKEVQNAMDMISTSCRLPVRFLECFPASTANVGSSVIPVVEAPTTRSSEQAVVGRAGDIRWRRAVAKNVSTIRTLTPQDFHEEGTTKPSVGRKCKKVASGRSARTKTSSDEESRKRKGLGQSSKPMKKRKVDVSKDSQKAVIPLKYPAKSPRRSNSHPVEGVPKPVETPRQVDEPERAEKPEQLVAPERKRSAYRQGKVPIKSPRNHRNPSPGDERQDGAGAASAAPMPDDEALSALPPFLTAFFSGIFSNGAISGSPAGPMYSPKRVRGTPSRPDKKNKVVGDCPSRASTLPPNLTSLISGMCGPTHQEWLSAIVKNQECMSGTTMDAASLLPPQFTSFLSGMLGDKVDFKNVTSVEEALELLPPTLANRLSCTILTPMQSSFFSNAKPKGDQSPSGGIGGNYREGKVPSSESGIKIKKLDIESEDSKPSAATALWRKDKDGRHEGTTDRAARFDQASPSTVVEKDLGALVRSCKSVRSSKSARSLLDDDGDDEVEDSKVQAARRLSFGHDLFHHNDQPL